MDVTAGTELRFEGALAQSPPAPFTEFFPARVSTEPTAEMATKPHEIVWTKCLAIPGVQHRLPAWHRVAAQPHPASSFKGTLMKRVGLSTRNTTRINDSKLLSATSVTQISEQDANYNPELGRAKRQRTISYTANHQGPQFSGEPVPQVDMIGLDMQSTVDVTNDIMVQPTTNTMKAFKLCRSGLYVRPCRTKRRLNVDFYPDQEGLQGGNRLETYLQLSPILKKAAELGLKHVTPANASIAHTLAKSRNIRRKPSRRSAPPPASTDLSNITDVTEPEDSRAIMKPPQFKAEATSPQKRVAKLANHFEGHVNRIAETKVTLLPGSSPEAEPSPTKSTSTPSTPFKEAPSPLSAILMNSHSGLSPQAAFMQAAVEQSPAPNGPTRVFKAPSYNDFSSSLPTVQEPQDLSPAKYPRPLAPTPSKWSLLEPSTPQQAATTPLHTGRDSLAAYIPPETPQSLQMALTTALLPAQFDFGTTQASFTSVGSPRWINDSTGPAEAQRVKNAKKSSRRKSEPLIQNYMRSKSRSHASPGKTHYKASRHSMHSQPAVNQGMDSPPIVAAPTAACNTPTIRVELADDAAPADKTPAARSLPKSRDVYDIDVRQNPDIFGSQMSSLAHLAESRCGGEANVVVQEENGRLFVRFKLPAEYARLFPSSQGADESHFTTTPSAISSSPRINFKDVYMPGDGAESVATPRHRGHMSSTPLSAQDRTLVIADFAPSPAGEDDDDASIISFPDAVAENQDTTVPGLGITLDEPFAGMSTPTPAHKDISGAMTSAEKDTPVATDLAQATTPIAPIACAIAPNTSAPITSFRPVNRPASRNGGSAEGPQPEKETKANENFSVELDDDSPGRDYMRGFIMRSKPKRLSTTETGSPIANPGKRQPLGAKSPNTESPKKAKRKHEDGMEGPQSPLHEKVEPEAKRARPNGKKPRKAAPASEPEDVSIKDTKATKATRKTAVDAADQTGKENADVAATRRSSRLKSQGKEAAPKSSIPTPIKLGQPRTGRSSTLNSSVRNEQQDLTHQTRVNTRKNKGNAEYPAQFLARGPEVAQGDESDGRGSDDSTSSQGRKCVEWKSPLAVYQVEKLEEEKREAEKPKKGKPGPKPKVTYKASGIAKPTRTTSTEQKQRTAKLAAHLGMSKNGTPAKPQRVTRSKTRTKA